MLFGEIIAIYPDNHAKSLNTFRVGQVQVY
jgi:hypothetical protein